MRQPHNNVFTPSASVNCDRSLGFVVLIWKNLFLKKRLVFFFFQAVQIFHTSILQMKALEKSKPKNNRPKPRFPLKSSIWAIILLIVVLSGGVLFSPGCSPVSLNLKFWGIEYQLTKGECSLPQLPPQ